jgi:hypothetical protein
MPYRMVLQYEPDPWQDESRSLYDRWQIALECAHNRVKGARAAALHLEQAFVASRKLLGDPAYDRTNEFGRPLPGHPFYADADPAAAVVDPYAGDGLLRRLGGK